MLKEPSIWNNEKNILKVRKESSDFLNANEDLSRKFASVLFSYHEIGDLVPQTLDNITSGHYFPYSQSYDELENSYQLALEGFYRYAFIALRSVLEIGLLGVYFAVFDNEANDVRDWMKSSEGTPKFKKIIKRMNKLDSYKSFDLQFGLSKRILALHSHLSDFVHTRGYSYSSTALSLSNINRFSEKSLRQYSDIVAAVVSTVVITMLIKYPIGMQGLPLTEKFGLDGPVGGLLERWQVEEITSILDPNEKSFLKSLSDQNNSVKQVVQGIENLPDLTDDQRKKQMEDFDNTEKHFKNISEQNGT